MADSEDDAPYETMEVEDTPYTPCASQLVTDHLIDRRKATVEQLKEVLGVAAPIPILDVVMHKPKERKLPEGGDGGERKGKMAADIEYSTKLVDRDNQILDERMFEAFRLGAQFGPEDKRVRRGSHHAKTNNSKQSRAKKEEMMTESGVKELEDAQQREVERTLALKRKDRTFGTHVISDAGPFPISGLGWTKKALQRTAVSATRKKKKMCDDCKLNGVKKPSECPHDADEEFAYGYQTDRLPHMRLARAESMSWLNMKILADCRHELRQQNTFVAGDPFGVYYQPSHLLHVSKDAQGADPIAIVGSLRDGYALFPRRIFNGSFMSAMFALAEGHLDGTLSIDDAVGGHQFLSGQIERVCSWIARPDDDVYCAQTAVWWAIGLCDLVSSTTAGRELMKCCGLTVFDRDMANMLFDYARSEINRREKDKKHKAKKKPKTAAAAMCDGASMLSESTHADDMHDSGNGYDDFSADNDGDNNHHRGGNLTDAYRQFLWWIRANRDLEHYTVLNTLVSLTHAHQAAALAEVAERQMSSIPKRKAVEVAASEHVRAMCDSFATVQTRISGMLNNEYDIEGVSVKPIPSVYRRTVSTVDDTVDIVSTMRVDKEDESSAIFLCDVDQLGENLSILHTRGLVPIRSDDADNTTPIDHLHGTHVQDEKSRRNRQDLTDKDATFTAKGVNGRNALDSSFAREARQNRMYGVNEQDISYTQTSERPSSFIVMRLMLPLSDHDEDLVQTMTGMTNGDSDGERFTNMNSTIHEPRMVPNSPLGVSFTTIRTVVDGYQSHHRGKWPMLAGCAEWGHPLILFDTMCKKPDVFRNGLPPWKTRPDCDDSDGNGDGDDDGDTGEKTIKTKERRRACIESTAKLAQTSPPPFLCYNDVKIERLTDKTTERVESCSIYQGVAQKKLTRSYASYAVTFQVPMQHARRLVDVIPAFQRQPHVRARHVLNLLHVGTIKALDTNELAKEKNAGDKEVMRKNARGAPVNDGNTELNCSVEEVYFGGIGNLTPTFGKSYYQGCYEWVPHGSGPKGADTGNFMSDNRRLGRSPHEKQTTEEIYAMQRNHFFSHVGGSRFEFRPDDFKFWPFANAAGVAKGLGTYYEAKKMLESVAPVEKELLPVLLAFPLSPYTQAIAPLVNPGNFDCGYKLSMSEARVPDFNTVGRADNVNATDELLALLNPTLFRPPSSQSSIDMSHTEMTDYGATWRALHVEVARITKDLVPGYDVDGVEAMRTLVIKYRSGETLPSDQRVIASTVLVMLNACNPRVFDVAKPVIVRMYAILAAVTAWEDAHDAPSERGTFAYWRNRLSEEELDEENAFFNGYFYNGPSRRGAWNAVAPLYTAIIRQNGHHFQDFKSFRAFESLFTNALRESVWYASSPDGFVPPPHVDGQLHPLEHVKGPSFIKRCHLEPAYIGRTITRVDGTTQHVATRGATFCIESFQAVQLLTLLNSASSIPLFDTEDMRGYGVQVYRNTGGMNVRISVDANIKQWGIDPKTKKPGWLYRSAKSTSIDQIDHDEIQNGTVADRRQSHAEQRVAWDANIRALATTVSILKPPMNETERMRGVDVEDKKRSIPPKEDVDALHKAIVDDRNLQSIRTNTTKP